VRTDPPLEIVEGYASSGLNILDSVGTEARTNVTLHTLDISAGKPAMIFFLSDLHAESPSCDLELARRIFERALKLKARIIINGDLFDVILPSDKKRTAVNAIRQEIIDMGLNVLGNIQLWVARFLQPYAHLIDVIGLGNHETAPIKHNLVDPIEELTKLLNTESHIIHRGEYSGFITYILKPTKTRTHVYPIFHHHGKRGGKSLGIIEFSDHLVHLDAIELMIMGHNHDTEVHWIPRSRRLRSGEIEEYKVWCARVGGTLGQAHRSYGALVGYPPKAPAYVEATLSVKGDRIITSALAVDPRDI